MLNASDNAEQFIHYFWESIKYKNVETVTKLSCLDSLWQQMYTIFQNSFNFLHVITCVIKEIIYFK